MADERIEEEELEEELEEETSEVEEDETEPEEELEEEPQEEPDEEPVEEALDEDDAAIDEALEAVASVEDEETEEGGDGDEELEAGAGDGLPDEQIGETTYEVEEDGPGGGGGGCASAILGSIVFFLIGIVLFPAAVYTVYRAENVKKTSKIVRALPMADLANPPASGLIKFEGTPTGTPLEAKKTKDKVWYYNYKYEREYVEKKIETERIKQGKKTIKKQTTKYVKVWKIDSSYSTSEWVDSLVFGKIKVVPSKNEKLYGTTTLKESGPLRVKGAPTLPPKTEGATGSVRYTVTGVKAEGPLLVVGVIENGTVEKGNDDDPKGAPFIIARKSSDELVKALEFEEEAAKWGLRILTFIMLYIGFIGIFNPLVKALEKIGEFGCGLDLFAKLFYLVDFLVSLFIVTVAVFFINYFWFFMFLLFLGFAAVGFAVNQALSKRKKG